MTTALDVINGAAKLIGVQFKGEQLDTDEANDALVQLNDMLDSWSNDNLVIYTDTLESFPLTAATSYTIGIGGTFNTVRPMLIKTAVARIGVIDYPIDIITQAQYETQIPDKAIAVNPVQYMVYSNDWPMGTITFYPNSLAGATLRLLSNKPLLNLTSLTTAVSLPPGWNRALKYNLAVEMAPQYGVQIPQEVTAGAIKSLGAIKRANAATNNAMPFTPESYTRGNIFSGWYV